VLIKSIISHHKSEFKSIFTSVCYFLQSLFKLLKLLLSYFLINDDDFLTQYPSYTYLNLDMPFNL